MKSRKVKEICKDSDESDEYRELNWVGQGYKQWPMFENLGNKSFI